jgi:hypothetical protein
MHKAASATGRAIKRKTGVRRLACTLLSAAEAGSPPSRARGNSRPEAGDACAQPVNTVAARTVHLNCNSGCPGANIAGKPSLFMPLFGFPTYVAKCAEVAHQGYAGLVLA